MRLVCAAFISMVLLLVAMGAEAFEQVHRFGVVEHRNLANRTLRIGGEIYQVDRDTRFADVEGRTIAFETFPVFDIYSGTLFQEEKSTKAEIRASLVGGVWQLESLKLISKLPD